MSFVNFCILLQINITHYYHDYDVQYCVSDGIPKWLTQFHLFGESHAIDANKCKERCGTNYELELKRIEKKVKLEANLKIPSEIKIEKAVKNDKEENKLKGSKTAPDVSNFKFYSLEEFDNKTNVHLAEFKGVFDKLESFKKTITKKAKSKSSFDLDFDC